MPTSHSTEHVPIQNHQQLVDYIASGEKPRSAWSIGTEHEKFGFRTDDLRPPSFAGERGIGVLLETLAKRFHWKITYEDEKPIALQCEGASITLEPAGQLELSGAMLKDLHQTCRELGTHLDNVQSVADDLGLGFLCTGFQPKWRRDQMPWMPKERYRIMRRYMPKVGSLGLDMMTRTCTVQVNLDFSSEADMVKKFRTSLALQPIATALFADSPFTEGQPNGYLSYRSKIWTDTDANRTGMLDFVFDKDFGYERYVDYMLGVPMYLSLQNGTYVDLAGADFRQFMLGKLPSLPGVQATMADFVDHLTTAFPEVRLKRFLEMRGADCGPQSQLCALGALWVGLLYDDTALDAAYDLTRTFTQAERHALREGVPRHALKLPFRQSNVRDWAREVLNIAAHGLKQRARLNDNGADERIFLDPLMEIVETNQTPAERKLALFHGVWGGNVDPIFRDFACVKRDAI